MLCIVVGFIKELQFPRITKESISELNRIKILVAIYRMRKGGEEG